MRCPWGGTIRKRGGAQHQVYTLALGVILMAGASARGGTAKQADAPKDTQQAVQATRNLKRIHALRANPHGPRLDGRLDDAIWARATFGSGFTQRQPDEGDVAANQTELAVVYDDEAVYIGMRMHCREPGNILSTVSRRDNVSNSERVVVSLDTYHDRRTAYTFGVTASGVRVDYYHASDREYNRDYGFDPVWRAATARTPAGWTAEMRIPFNQLRFNSKENQVWGINANRWVPTDNEDSYWVLVPKDETGWSSRMGELVGVAGIKSSRRVELMPYVANDATFSSNVAQGDPFHDGEEFAARLGADFKMGVGPNLTLEGTVNPDFGQVEADPAEVNLSAFETFFSERRPFFTEGSNLLNGGGSGYFYSRRIGSAPHLFPSGDFVERPDNTSILGAAKLSGRLHTGLSIGALGAVTGREHARVFDEATRTMHEEEVEPLTGFGVIRLQQELGTEASTVGIIMTGMQRDVTSGTPLGDLLRRRAFSGGTDWNLRFQGGTYELGGKLGFSRIEGSRASILDAQRSSARYFQRPDAGHVHIDPTRTSLTGWTSGLWFSKEGGKHWLGGMGATSESPGFELNDAGRLGSADDIETWTWLRYRETKPGRWFQDWWINLFANSGWNFDGDRQNSYMNLESRLTFKNYMGSFVDVGAWPSSQSDNLTRGGPSMGRSSGWNMDVNLWSNAQKKTQWNGWLNYSRNAVGGWSYNVGGGLTLRPGARWELSVRPRWNQRVTSRQYITTESGGGAATFGSRYIFSFIEQSQLVTQLRLNYAFTPDLTLELYAEPFAASGRYYRFGELPAARSEDLRRYGTDGTSIVSHGDGTYTVTDGASSFDINQPDFNIVSFRSNLVLRWEWSPGSTLFLVWQQNRSDFEESGRLVSPSRLLDTFSADGDNFVAVKLTYWIPFL